MLEKDVIFCIVFFSSLPQWSSLRHHRGKFYSINHVIDKEYCLPFSQTVHYYFRNLSNGLIFNLRKIALYHRSIIPVVKMNPLEKDGPYQRIGFNPLNVRKITDRAILLPKGESVTQSNTGLRPPRYHPGPNVRYKTRFKKFFNKRSFFNVFISSVVEPTRNQSVQKKGVV